MEDMKAHWERVESLARQAESLTAGQVNMIEAAWDAAEEIDAIHVGSAAWGAAIYAATCAGRSDHWQEAGDAARSAATFGASVPPGSSAVSAAMAAMSALCVLDLVGQHDLEQHHLDTLLAPWRVAFPEAGR